MSDDGYFDEDELLRDEEAMEQEMYPDDMDLEYEAQMLDESPEEPTYAMDATTVHTPVAGRSQDVYPSGQAGAKSRSPAKSMLSLGVGGMGDDREDILRQALNSAGLSTSPSPDSKGRWKPKSADYYGALALPQSRRPKPAPTQDKSGALSGGLAIHASNIKRLSDRTSAILRRPPMDCDSIVCTLDDGARAHLRVIPPEPGPGDAADQAVAPGGFLKVPVQELLRRVEAKRVAEMARAMAVAAGDTEEQPVGPAPKASGVLRGVGKGSLWVDKYAPTIFSQLLSDERTNREVLRELRSWDSFVFGREAPAPAAVAASKFNSKFNSGKGPANPGQHTPATPGDKRPACKVILLCGPPGMGKTTLAHVVARKAGYRPMEINASDDRTASVLRENVIRAMENRSVFGDQRPNCIILDEVDGTEGKAAVAALLDIITCPLQAHKEGGGRKKKGSAHPLTRPLILICNDQYSSALRPLRQVSKVFAFRKATCQRLVQRLKAICSQEKLQVSTQALTSLAESSSNDIRSCLNTLQFVAHRVSHTAQNASAALLEAVSAGIKDERKDIFQVWTAVFRRQKQTRRRLFGQAEDAEGDMSVSSDSNIYELMEGYNDYPKVMQGVHETMLSVRSNDPTMRKAAAALDWVGYADLMGRLVEEQQLFYFNRYVPAAAAGIHLLCRSDTRPNLTMPKRDYMFFMARTQKENILQAFNDGRHLASSGRTAVGAALDVMSYLLDIVAPKLRPVTLELLSAVERKTLDALVDVMLDTGLTFVQGAVTAVPGGADNPWGRSLGFSGGDWVLEPAIDQLVTYSGYPYAHHALGTTGKQMVAHQAKIIAMRRREAQVCAADTGCPDLPAHAEDAAPGRVEGPVPGGAAAPPSAPRINGSSKRPRETSRDAAAGSVDSSVITSGTAKGDPTTMMGDLTVEVKVALPPDKRMRPIPLWNRFNMGSTHCDTAQTPRSDLTGESEPPRNLASMRYKFMAGYTNAIRRPVRLKDLL